MPVVTGGGHAAQVGQHQALVGIAQVHMHGDAVGAVLDAFFHGAHQGLGVALGREHGGGGQVDDEAHVLAGVAVRAADQALMHEHGVSAAHGHVVDGLAHVDEAVDGTDGHAVVHGNDDSAAGFTIDDAFQTNLFAKVHGISPCGMEPFRRRWIQKKGPPANACGPETL